MRDARAERDEPERYPIRGIFVGCCASEKGAVVSRIMASNHERYFTLFIVAPVLADN
jgi:hypothetical protein